MDRDIEVLPALPTVGTLLVRGALRRGRPGAEDGLPGRTVMVLDHAQDAARLAAYDRVCGFGLTDRVPATWLHVLTFPLQAHLMAARDFPFALAGLVHLRNELTLHRPVTIADRLRLSVRVENLADHRLGYAFDMVGEVCVGDELAWSGRSTYLARRPDASRPDAPRRATASSGDAAGADPSRPAEASSDKPRDALPPPSQRWRLAADLGRQYAAVSGDTNPIHLYAVTARAFGFPRPIIQGMWTQARVLAALAGRLGLTYTASGTFTKPILLPGTATFGVIQDADGIRYAVMDSDASKPYLAGAVTGS